MEAIISETLSDQGFDIKTDFRIKKGFYADIIGTKDNNALVVEVKPKGFKSDQSDFMQIWGYMGAMRKSKRFENMEIRGCIVSSGTITPATPLIQNFGIRVIDSDKEDIRTGIINCSRQFGINWKKENE